MVDKKIEVIDMFVVEHIIPEMKSISYFNDRGILLIGLNILKESIIVEIKNYYNYYCKIEKISLVFIFLFVVMFNLVFFFVFIYLKVRFYKNEESIRKSIYLIIN